MRAEAVHRAELVLDRMDDAVVVIAPGWTVESCNRAFLRLTGYESGVLVGRSADRLFDDQGIASEIRTRVLGSAGRASVSGLAHLRLCSGGVLPVRYSFSLLGDPADNGAEGIMLVVHDQRAMEAKEREIRGLARFSDENPFPVLRISADGTLLYANEGSWLLLSHWQTSSGKPVPQRWAALAREALEQRENREVEEQIGFKTILVEVIPVPDMGYVNLFGLDVTQRREVEKKLLLDAQVFENATEGVMITDTERRILDVNRAFCDITGYSREEVLGENASILQSGRHDPEFYHELWSTVRERGTWQGEIWDRRKNGEVYPKWLSISSVLDENGAVIRYIGLFSDITAMKRTQDELYQMANYDSLTGLANRRYLHDLLEKDLQQARRNGTQLAAMFVDLDGFKPINDHFGHRAGDLLLKEVADRLKACVRDSDTVGRIGGDEFTVVLTSLTHPNGAMAVAQKILRSIREPVSADQQEVFVGASIGISLFPDDADDVEGMLRCADAALHQAKDVGKNGYQFFSTEMNQRSRERLSYQMRLRKGIDADELLVHYQPQLNSLTDRVHGVEALVRWRNAERGEIPPEQFIPLAEDTGLIHEVGDVVLRTTLAQAVRWQAEGLPPFDISINLSPYELRRADCIPRIESAIRDSGVPARRLVFELTESVLIDDFTETFRRLQRLKGIGARIAVDDFGTKYSSLAYLRRLPIDRLKIDKLFLKDFPQDLGSVGITTAIIAICNSLNLEVIAEGVETEEQMMRLQEKGCTLIQGHYYCRPLPAEELRPFLKRHLA